MINNCENCGGMVFGIGNFCSTGCWDMYNWRQSYSDANDPIDLSEDED